MDHKNKPGEKGEGLAGHHSMHKAEGKKWIAKAIKHPGALHKELGVPAGEKIPAAKMEKALHSKNPTERKRANLAKTLSKMHHGK